MTITAVWPISSGADPNSGDGMTITEPSGIDDLIARLAEANAGPATVWHEGRELADDATGMLDHDVVIHIAGGYGYASFLDPEHDYAVLDGEPESPAVHLDDAEFPAGSGVGVPVLAAMLRELLETGQRPASVGWQPADW